MQTFVAPALPSRAPRAPRTPRTPRTPRAPLRPRCCAVPDGRESEFSVSGPRRTPGIQWDAWRGTPGTKAPMPLLPFQAHEVMLPGEEKTLHLFEARYLALFDEAVLNYERRFGHILLSAERAALAASGTLVSISEWQRLDVGVRVRLQGIGRIQVSAVEVSAAGPFIQGSVSFVEDLDSATWRAPAAPPAEQADETPIDALLAHEEEFWTLALRLVEVCVELEVAPFRSKKAVAPPPIAGALDFGPPSDPPAHLQGQERAMAYLEMLRASVDRASWPASGAATALDDDVATRCRLRAVSFVGYDLFDSNAGQRQRSLELKSTAERFARVLDGVRDRLKMLDAQLSLRRAGFQA